MTTTDTRQRLLDAAEQLFADHGCEGTSLRAITAAAEANLAAVNYHFQSKEGLIAAVFQRRLEPMNQERLRQLDRCEQAAAPDAPPLDAIIRAFIGPPLRLRLDPDHGGEHFARLMGRMFSETSEVKLLIMDQFRDVAQRFFATFGRVLPDLPQPELLWRIHFLVGILSHTASAGEIIQSFSQGACDPDDVEGTIDRIVAFAAAGFCAPLPPTTESPEP